MANPQLENGYTRIANETLLALSKYGLPKREMQVLLVVFRYTYGYGKKTAYIQHNIFKDETLMNSNSISKARKNLKDRNMLTVAENGNGFGFTYRFNKNYHTWKSLPKMADPISLPKMADPPAENGNETGFLPISIKEKKKERTPSLQFKKKVPLPKDFCLTENMRHYAEKQRYVADLESFTESFMTKCRAKGFKYQDWYAAWQTWLRQDIKWHPENQAPEVETV